MKYTAPFKAKLLGFVYVALTLCCTSVHSQQTIQMTAISGYAPVATWIREFRDYFIPEINKKLAVTGKYKIIGIKLIVGKLPTLAVNYRQYKRVWPILE